MSLSILILEVGADSFILTRDNIVTFEPIWLCGNEAATKRMEMRNSYYYLLLMFLIYWKFSPLE